MPAGVLARLAVTRRDAIEKSGFDAWMQQLNDGKVMAFAIEQARDEFERCLAELNATGHSVSCPSWQRDKTFHAGMEKAWARHRAEPLLTAEAYLHRCHKELRATLEGRTLVYLDTCRWIHLREVTMGDSRADGRYAPILTKLRELKRAGKISCPFSFPVFIELKKQTSDATRRAMAELIDELADGVCLQAPDTVEQIELKRQILRSVLTTGTKDLNEWI